MHDTTGDGDGDDDDDDDEQLHPPMRDTVDPSVGGDDDAADYDNGDDGDYVGLS